MNALFYPFHLCHELTLDHLLQKYPIVHFRDFMALQLTPMMGTTAFPDRMGDYYPEQLQAGQIVQGYRVNGPLPPDMIPLINRDLADSQWRNIFQECLQNNHRFQHGLFPPIQEGTADSSGNAAQPEWFQFQDRQWALQTIDVQSIQRLSTRRPQETEATLFEYGWALIKTSASLFYTIQLCQKLDVIAATDSLAHYHLLTRTCERDQVSLNNHYMTREDY